MTKAKLKIITPLGAEYVGASKPAEEVEKLQRTLEEDDTSLNFIIETMFGKKRIILSPYLLKQCVKQIIYEE